jgi:hypothetical protein
VPGLPATAIHRNGQYALVWRPHLEFASCLPDGKVPCPGCGRGLVVNDAKTRNVRQVMARDRTIHMIGCAYRCKSCAGGCSVGLGSFELW